MVGSQCKPSGKPENEPLSYHGSPDMADHHRKMSSVMVVHENIVAEQKTKKGEEPKGEEPKVEWRWVFGLWMWWQLVAILEVAEDKQVPDVVRPPFDVGLSMGTRQGRSRM